MYLGCTRREASATHHVADHLRQTNTAGVTSVKQYIHRKSCQPIKVWRCDMQGHARTCASNDNVNWPAMMCRHQCWQKTPCMDDHQVSPADFEFFRIYRTTMPTYYVNMIVIAQKRKDRPVCRRVCLCVWCGVVWCAVWCGTLKTPCVDLKRSPCVHSKRPRVYRHHAHMLKSMRACCRHTRGRFESTHGGVF